MYGYATPNPRYYADTQSIYPPVFPIQQQHYISNSVDRYAKFRSQPVNLSRANPQQQYNHNLGSSNIYTKQGLLKRNQVGWDAVKLTEYVTQQISEDYLKNQKILDKFRIQAEQQRRKKKFGHALSGVFDYRSNIQLPPISTPVQMTPVPVVHQPTHSQVLSYHHSIQEDDEIQVEQPRFRNVGVNTHKMYQKIQLQKYLRLMNKYQSLKEKYHKERNQRRLEKKRYQQREQQKQEQMQSIDKIKHIQSELVNISTRLKTSNQFLQDQLKYSKITQHSNPNNNSNTNFKQTPKHSGRRLKTEPTAMQPQQQQQYQRRHIQPIVIPQNPMKQYMQSSSRKTKTPTVVYTTRKYTDLHKVTQYS